MMEVVAKLRSLAAECNQNAKDMLGLDECDIRELYGRELAYGVAADILEQSLFKAVEAELINEGEPMCSDKEPSDG